MADAVMEEVPEWVDVIMQSAHSQRRPLANPLSCAFQNDSFQNGSSN